MKKFVILLNVSLFSLLCAGCGQKGPLFLPKSSTASSSPIISGNA